MCREEAKAVAARNMALVLAAGMLSLACGGRLTTTAGVAAEAPPPVTQPAEEDLQPRPCPERVFEGDYGVTDEASLAALEDYTRVTGTLRIGGPDLENIEWLGCLREVGGDLEIGGDALTNVDGLSGLISVAGSVDIHGTFELANVDGLTALTDIGGHLSIARNDALQSLDGLSDLTSVGSDLYVSSNPALPSLDGLRGLASIDGHLSIRNNAALPTCEAEALRDRFAAAGWTGTFSIVGNDDRGVCQ